MHRVLLVEDDPDTSEVVLLALRSSGFEVLSADNQADAYRQIIAERLDAIVLDISVIEDKAHFIALIREKDLPVIVCSAAEEFWIRDFQSVLTYAVKKPFEIEELIRVVNTACCSRIK